MNRRTTLLILAIPLLGLLLAIGAWAATSEIEMPVREPPAPPPPVVLPLTPAPFPDEPAEQPATQPTSTAIPQPTAPPIASVTSVPPENAAAAQPDQPTPPAGLERNTLNIVLLGSDRRPGSANWRTDTIIIVLIDVGAKRVGVVSLPRDLWVGIAGRESDRINTLDHTGGPPLVKQVVGSYVGVPIDYYVRVDFDAFVKAVNAIGGITVDVECPLLDGFPDPGAPGGIRRLEIPAGRVFMDGQTALGFSRSRLGTSGWERMRRQGRVLLGIREKVLSPEIFVRVPSLISVMGGFIQTDVPARNIVPLARLASQTRLADVHGLLVDHTMTQQAYSPQGYWVVVPDVPKIQAAVHGIFSAPSLAEAVRRPWPCPL